MRFLQAQRAQSRLSKVAVENPIYMAAVLQGRVEAGVVGGFFVGGVMKCIGMCGSCNCAAINYCATRRRRPR